MRESPPPVVSVITPAYNAEGTIPQTIASCLAQTFRDFELLVVDDGSTDRTPAIVREYGERDARVQLLSRCNGGTAAARNVALAQAQGRYIALLDSDDLWMDDYLATVVSTMERRPEIAIVTANAINLGGSRHRRPLWPVVAGERDLSLLDLITRENSVCIMSTFRREVWESIGGFDEQFRSNEDYDYWLRAARAGFRIMADLRPLGFYRRRPDSMSADEGRMLEGITRVLLKFRDLVPAASEELSAIDRQLARFRREQMTFEAAMALRRGNPAAALAFLKLIPPKDRSRRVSLAVALSQISPSVLALAFRARTVLRDAAAWRRAHAGRARTRVLVDRPLRSPAGRVTAPPR